MNELGKTEIMSKKPYDTTLARIAGNIASGICANTETGMALKPAEIAQRSMDIADWIVQFATQRAVRPEGPDQ